MSPVPLGCCCCLEPLVILVHSSSSRRTNPPKAVTELGLEGSREKKKERKKRKKSERSRHEMTRERKNKHDTKCKIEAVIRIHEWYCHTVFLAGGSGTPAVRVAPTKKSLELLSVQRGTTAKGRTRWVHATMHKQGFSAVSRTR